MHVHGGGVVLVGEGGIPPQAFIVYTFYYLQAIGFCWYTIVPVSSLTLVSSLHDDVVSVFGQKRLRYV